MTVNSDFLIAVAALLTAILSLLQHRRTARKEELARVYARIETLEKQRDLLIDGKFVQDVKIEELKEIILVLVKQLAKAGIKPDIDIEELMKDDPDKQA